MGVNAMGNMMGGFSQMNHSAQGQQGTQPQTAAQAVAGSWTCECGNVNTGKFCSNCGKPAPVKNEWTCECGAVNTGKFCSNCGKPAPAGEWTCACGTTNTGKFCSNCGKPR
jgi:membrane protease subunit (stomatin/prohibitin family)